MKAKKKLAPLSSSSLNEQEQETSSLEKTPVQLSKIQKTDEKGKGMGNSLKLKPYSAKIECFTLPETEKAYRTNFSRKNVFGECEIFISNLSDIVFAFIKEIFTKKQMGKVDSRGTCSLCENCEGILC